MLRVGTLLSEQHLGDANDEYVDASDEEDNDEEGRGGAGGHWTLRLEIGKWEA